MLEHLPFSPACENNKAAILSVLKLAFANCQRVLEVGSGTGQHAEYFASQMPHLQWQCSDQAQYVHDLQRRLHLAKQPNLPPAIPLDVRSGDWPLPPADALFSANTMHIMAWPVVQVFFQRLTSLVSPKAELCIYGPFNDQGCFSSSSNRQFHRSLQQRDPSMGIRDQEAVVALAADVGFHLHAAHSMPANNRLLHFSR